MRASPHSNSVAEPPNHAGADSGPGPDQQEMMVAQIEGIAPPSTGIIAPVM
jgi:hypothetical protein